MKDINWRGLIAAILAGGLSVTLVLSIAELLFLNRPMSEKGTEVMVALTVAMVAAISTYLASNSENKK